jgi:hypothetical protein
MEDQMRVSRARTIAAAPMRPVAITVLTIAALVSVFLVMAAGIGLSPFHVQHEAYRYGVNPTLR